MNKGVKETPDNCSNSSLCLCRYSFGTSDFAGVKAQQSFYNSHKMNLMKKNKVHNKSNGSFPLLIEIITFIFC